MLSVIPIPTAKGVLYCHPKEIARLQARGSYTCIYFTGDKKILVAKVLKKFERLLLQHGFVGTHRTHLVNRIHIAGITKEGSIVMKDQSTVEISRRMKLKCMVACAVYCFFTFLLFQKFFLTVLSC